MQAQGIPGRLLLIAAAAPGLVAIAVSAAISLLGGSGPFWRGGTLTLSEAAALHDHADVVRLIEEGNDPDATYPLRRDILGEPVMTPLEAAVRSRRAEVVDLLMMHGATMGPSMWRRLHCFALEAQANDLAQTLDQYRPGAVNQSCAGL